MPSIGIGIQVGRNSGKKSWENKMWASYIQLNPGVYSDAIATEFKNRMKPTYVDSNGTGYYYNTFGPSGLNKTTADWIYLLTCSGDLTQEAMTKSGAVTKWNLDGTIITQNSPPAYTKGSNAGIITMSSIDGWSGVTAMFVSSTNYSGILPRFNFVGINGANAITWINCTMTGDINLSLGTPKPTIQNFAINSFVSISGLGNMLSNNISSMSLNFNVFSTSEVDRVLAYYNTMFAATPPIKNLTLDLSGATMGIPTGAGSNTDLLGILAKFTTAGFTATIIVRTS